MPDVGEIIQKGQLTKLFFKNFFRRENLRAVYIERHARQDMMLWAFLIGTAVTAFLGWKAALLLVGLDILRSFWIGMKLNGLWENPGGQIG